MSWPDGPDRWLRVLVQAGYASSCSSEGGDEFRNTEAFSAEEVEATVRFFEEESETVSRSSAGAILEVLLEASAGDGEELPQSYYEDPREAYTRLRIQA